MEAYAGPAVITNPFPGLRAFEKHEHVLFFGREKQVADLLKKLQSVRFLSIIGSSGSGKSSLVNSGLIPALHNGLMSGAGKQWRVCTFRPGIDPIGNLAQALAVCADDGVSGGQAAIENSLRSSDLALVDYYQYMETSGNLLILADQFEELFRFNQDKKASNEGLRDAVIFINLLIKASEQRELPIYVALSMRADFLGDCTEFAGLPEAINEGQYLVPRMTRQQISEAISGPITLAGAQIEHALLHQLLDDIGDSSDQLPILQHALMRTWDNWLSTNSGALNTDHYEQIGTLAYALSLHAEEAFAELKTPSQRQICEVMFKALTDKGTGLTGIRRPVNLKDICSLTQASESEVIAVINVYRMPGRGFLMPPAYIELSSDSMIDISHESFMRIWERLILWVDEENQSSQLYSRLCDAAELYETGKGGLLRDPELQMTLKWKEENKPNAAWANRYNELFEKAVTFLAHSKQEHDHELELKAFQQKADLKHTRRIALVIGVIAFAAFLLSIYAFQLKTIAIKHEKQAELDKKHALDQEHKAEAAERKAEASEKKAEYLEVQALSLAKRLRDSLHHH